MAATDCLLLQQPFEASNINDFAFGTANAQRLSLSFWVKSSVAGTFTASLQNAAQNRTLAHAFTIPASGVWTFVTVPNIIGDTGGTWIADGAVRSLTLCITMAVGSTYQTSTLDAWVGSNVYGASSQTNSILITTGATFQVTGVMLNTGAFCQPFEKRLIQRELQDCQRYYFQLNASPNGVIGYGWAQVANNAEIGVPFPVPMRIIPTYTAPGTASHVQANFQTANAVAVTTGSAPSINIGTIQITVSSGIAFSAACAARWFSSSVNDAMSWTARM